MSRVAIICGGNYLPSDTGREALIATMKLHDITHVMHGAHEGADMFAHKVLKAAGLWVLAVPTLPRVHGTTAVLKQQEEMAKMADLLHDAWEPRRPPVCVVFDGGKACDRMVEIAKRLKFEIVRVK